MSSSNIRIASRSIGFCEMHLMMDKPLNFIKDLIEGNKIPTDLYISFFNHMKTLPDDYFSPYFVGGWRDAKDSGSLSGVIDSFVSMLSGDALYEEAITVACEFFTQSSWYNPSVTKREILAAMQEESDLLQVPLSLFGSFARDSNHLMSDIDILVHYDELNTSFEYYELEDRLSQRLGRLVSAVPVLTIRPEILKSVQKDLHMLVPAGFYGKKQSRSNTSRVSNCL